MFLMTRLSSITPTSRLADFLPMFPLAPIAGMSLALVIRRGEQRLLTPHEDALLRLLLAAPNRWHKTVSLAAALAERLDLEEISEVSIRQTVMSLRAKLGESAKSPTLLQCQPGHGYGLFPLETPRFRP